MASFGISVPEQIQSELDRLADFWLTDRSKTIVRIYQEWRTAAIQNGTFPLTPQTPAPNGEVVREQ